MIDKEYRVVISPLVYDRILEIYRYICQNSPTGAKHVKTELVNAMKSLKNFPERYPYYDAISFPKKKFRKMVVMKRYLIFYQIVNYEVRIHCIVDGKQDYEQLL